MNFSELISSPITSGKGQQWDNFLQNLGDWEGSFISLTPKGEVISSTPSLLSLESLDNHQVIRLQLRRFSTEAQNPETNELIRQYSSIGRDLLFFPTGAFSQGTIQRAPFSEFGAELALVTRDRRLRVVQLFDPDGQLSKLTLIPEKRAGTNAPEMPPLTLDQLLGTWQGEAHTLYPDWRSPDTFSTQLQLTKIAENHIEQQLSFGQTGNLQTLTSTGQVHGNQIHFEGSSPAVQVLLLSGGASATCPVQIQRDRPFFLEAGWLIQPNFRQRIIRRYSEKGEWISLTLVTEQKIA